ncbi:MAG: sensor histidine kinase [Candidatus Accumulibacter sp.]|jgi:two-component system C4-dicarboxylate transport sensor histidine kinase DctB|nr:sensor histidine kinase [Accumulibacter sp.]
MPRRFPRLILACTAIVLAAAGVALAAYRFSQQQALLELQATGRHRLDLYAASLEREIGKYAYFPDALGLERDGLDLLDARLTGKVNYYLEELNERAGTLLIYILNRTGRVLASSNWRQPDSSVGEDLSSRPYFRDALARGKGRFFGIGTTRGEPGYYLSSALTSGNNVIGVAVVKVSLEQLENSWSTVEAPVFVSDENGVIILSSVPAWKFSTPRPIDEKTRAAFERTQQYPRDTPQAFAAREIARLGEHARIVRIAREKSEAASVYPVSGEFLAQSQPLRGSAWTLTVYSSLGQVDEMSAVRAAAAGVTTVLLCIVALLFNERRKHLQERLAAREALQKAHDELERKVEERTRDLSLANRQLQEEVAERSRAERTLRAAQDELIQAGKLAVIGQLSAGIVHELNQPLAALRTLSANTVRFLERGDEATAHSNLKRIGQLVDRMGQITGELKGFAKKSSGQPRPADLRQIVSNAIGLLGQRLRGSGAQVSRRFPETPVCALCDANRMEQVVINLLGNALDAMAGQASPRIDIDLERVGRTIRLEIRDHGAGIADELLPRLFEPFFTTKEAGLGLGLALSSGIVGDFGGTLGGRNHPEGGMVFILELPLAEDERSS